MAWLQAQQAIKSIEQYAEIYVYAKNNGNDAFCNKKWIRLIIHNCQMIENILIQQSLYTIQSGCQISG